MAVPRCVAGGHDLCVSGGGGNERAMADLHSDNPCRETSGRGTVPSKEPESGAD